MKVSALKYAVLTWVSRLTMLIFLLVPFHALLTVWLASHFGQYTAFRLWKEVLLAACLIGVVYLFATDQKIRFHTISRRLVQIILVYVILNFAWALLALNQHDATLKAAGYGLLLNLRFLAFFLVTWSVALRMSKLRTHWQRLVLWPAAIVIAFGLLQALILPHDFLRHFGYNDSTIPAVETINHNQHYVRIMSTLRGANPLGAYLVVPISLISVLLIRRGRQWKQGLFLAGALLTSFLSFSRSAWLGAAAAIITLLVLSHLSRRGQKVTLAAAVVVILIGGGVALGLHNSQHFQNFVLHTQTHSAVSSTSNQGHATAIKNGLSDVWHHPLGSGPGTAGPASVYNGNHPVRIAENYFIQVGPETGWRSVSLPAWLA
jgi:hypothetical protein